ncbi:MAG TPA: enoyl-CoA hydratase [Acidimicrobiales bacterium]|nr:enoyl-CoA hydratase [Acidimicrobiales bacterium]
MSGLKVEVTDARVAVVTIDEGERRNALTLPLVDEIVETFDRLEASGDVGAFVITGAPPAFCAGADLGDLGRTGGSTSSDKGLRSIYEGFLRVARSPFPTLAAVNGAAVGAGMNLALCCDVRIAGRSARFDTRFLKLGLHPGGGHTWMLQRAIGPQGAAAMVLFGDILDGEAAEKAGLVWRCVDDDALLDEARRLAARAADTPPELAKRAKDVLRQMPGVPTHDEAVDLELTVQTWSAQQPFFAERLAAIRERVQQKK